MTQPLFQAVRVCVIAGMFLSAGPEAFGTAGIAEWAVATPLGNEVNHTDPFIEEGDGTSIRSVDASGAGVPFVKKLLSWTFYVDYIAGQAGTGFFLFNETTKKIEYFKDEAAQKKRMQETGVLNPISRPYSNEKGWMEVWAENRNPAVSSPDELVKLSLQTISSQEWFQKLPDDLKERQRKMLQQKVEYDVKFLNEEHDFYRKVKREIDGYPEFKALTELQKEKVKHYIEQRWKASTFVVEKETGS